MNKQLCVGKDIFQGFFGLFAKESNENNDGDMLDIPLISFPTSMLSIAIKSKEITIVRAPSKDSRLSSHMQELEGFKHFVKWIPFKMDCALSCI